MNYIVCVQILETEQNTADEEFDNVLRKSFASSYLKP